VDPARSPSGVSVRRIRYRLAKTEWTRAVKGCLEGSKWCAVDHNGAEGWVFSDYLAADLSGARVVVSEGRADIGVPAVTYKGAGGTVAGAAGGGQTTFRF
jgi:uncharacterized protein YraI